MEQVYRILDRNDRYIEQLSSELDSLDTTVSCLEEQVKCLNQKVCSNDSSNCTPSPVNISGVGSFQINSSFVLEPSPGNILTLTALFDMDYILYTLCSSKTFAKVSCEDLSFNKISVSSNTLLNSCSVNGISELIIKSGSSNINITIAGNLPVTVVDQLVTTTSVLPPYMNPRVDLELMLWTRNDPNSILNFDPLAHPGLNGLFLILRKNGNIQLRWTGNFSGTTNRLSVVTEDVYIKYKV